MTRTTTKQVRLHPALALHLHLLQLLPGLVRDEANHILCGVYATRRASLNHPGRGVHRIPEQAKPEGLCSHDPAHAGARVDPDSQHRLHVSLGSFHAPRTLHDGLGEANHQVCIEHGDVSQLTVALVFWQRCRIHADSLVVHFPRDNTDGGHILVPHSLHLVHLVIVAQTIKHEKQIVKIIQHGRRMHLRRERRKALELGKRDADSRVMLRQVFQLLLRLDDKVFFLQLLDNGRGKHAVQQVFLQLCVLCFVSNDFFLLLDQDHPREKLLPSFDLLHKRSAQR
mmetsp:Transcript_2123/g.4810  ORF Transcript_2123/g.4810 Transcript_2123/m.4810 type:complete len:283 (+) Transcript_2123:1881-2729(+)